MISIENLNSLVVDLQAALNQVGTLPELEQLRSQYLGKKGHVTELLKELVKIDPADRPKVGQIVNSVKDNIAALIGQRVVAIKQEQLNASLHAEALDITLPGRGQQFGSIHPITQIRFSLEDFFTSMGFSIVEGPEVETEFYNFSALNIPTHHPARAAHDTFYFADGTMLRSQTTPVQIRAMQTMGAPLRVICPGRVYRCDNDATHAPMFHQLEGLLVDENINLGHLKSLINKMLEHIFQEKIEYRFRPSYFPFVEPGAEVDVKWRAGDGWRWLELGGCGMVHPKVLQAGGIDPSKYSGFAFGFGLDRLAMRHFGITDIRLMFTNDLQFLRQF